MSRIAETFDALRRRHRKGLIPFFTAGDPHPSLTVPLMHALVQAGADVLELGVPFSDPMAEGPVIQRACERALAFDIGLEDVLAMVHHFRQADPRTPVVLMGYANPIEHMGIEPFAAAAAQAGVDGVIVVDYPPQEAEALNAALERVGLDMVFLLAPTSTEARMKEVGRMGRGFSYYVSLKGVTGASHIDTGEVAQRLALIRRHVKLPMGVGFGIRDAQTARAVASVADAVIIGSKVIQEMAAVPREEAVEAARRLIADIRQALDQPL
ncbi:tryptophan synthase subunit alpha [Aquabacterium sp. CECT 9606]|uniref:tryptophan synthase subunit alpha n=1 Tax=Aquabacterium sp. CECT 9606 TaxID=2845822 RepID=UPI001E4ED2DD|nr:tryptophan synthase subunit alpha [Aquabacterium sp. CECT 9606]CAH0354896.1 Tryptophan synthase alpha chain [Aquabacterium sp. CECT 9606]